MTKDQWIVLDPLGPGLGLRFVGPFKGRKPAEAFIQANKGGLLGLLNDPEGLPDEEVTA